MRNFVAVVFDGRSKAYDGLHALWQLDDEGDVTRLGRDVADCTDKGCASLTAAAPRRRAKDRGSRSENRWR